MHLTWLFLFAGLGTGASASSCHPALCTVAEPKAAGQILSPISNVYQPSLLAFVTLVKLTELK